MEGVQSKRGYTMIHPTPAFTAVVVTGFPASEITETVGIDIRWFPLSGLPKYRHTEWVGEVELPFTTLHIHAERWLIDLFGKQAIIDTAAEAYANMAGRD